MKIVIDARMLYWTGVGRYTKALLDNLEQLDHENEYVVLMRPADRKLWRPSANNFRIVETDINPYSLSEQLALPRLIRSLSPDFVHFTTPNGPALYRGKRIDTVHDLTLLDFDTSRGVGLLRWLRGLKRIPFRLILKWNVARATTVVTVTEYVAQQLVKRFGVDKARIATTLLASDPQLAAPEPIEKFGAGQRYLLYWGNYYSYKNVGILVDALALLAGSHQDLKLVLGGNTDVFRDTLEEHAQELGVKDRVVFVGFVSDGELVALCRNATAYVNPSLSEGFGLQGLEAMTQGCPVLAARATCLPEVYGKAAVYFDPHDPKDLAEKIGELMRDKSLREKMRRAGYERLKKFAWRKTAEQTLEVYRRTARTEDYSPKQTR